MTLSLILAGAAASAASAPGISSELVCEMLPGPIHAVEPGSGKVRLPKHWTVHVTTPVNAEDLVTYDDPLIGQAAPAPFQWATRSNFVGTVRTRAGKKEWMAYYSVLLSSPGEGLIRTEYTLVARRDAKEEVYALSARGNCHELLLFPKQEK